VLPEDIKEVCPDVFNHRVLLNYEAEADGVTTLQVIDSILRKVAIGR
jgi:MoxR-like ATPase